VSEQLLTILKLCLLALLYLFFFRVLRAVWAELRASAQTAPAGGRGARARVAAAPMVAAPAPAPPVAAKPAPSPAPRKSRGYAGELVVTEPADRKGQVHPVAIELTIGRAGGCAISLPDDTFVSSMHARVFIDHQGSVLVEDLGSTNGTFLNGTKVTAPVALMKGDTLKVGNTVFEGR